MEWTIESIGVTVEINVDDCSLCTGHPCIGACEALSFSYGDGHAHLRDPELCNGCGECVDRCLFMAITVNT